MQQMNTSSMKAKGSWHLFLFSFSYFSTFLLVCILVTHLHSCPPLPDFSLHRIDSLTLTVWVFVSSARRRSSENSRRMQGKKLAVAGRWNERQCGTNQGEKDIKVAMKAFSWAQLVFADNCLCLQFFSLSLFWEKLGNVMLTAPFGLWCMWTASDTFCCTERFDGPYTRVRVSYYICRLIIFPNFISDSNMDSAVCTTHTLLQACAHQRFLQNALTSFILLWLIFPPIFTLLLF